ncbi:MAG: glycoside hydrolase family 20 zincin-like fold domain-containing protein [Pirellulales bacterium]
MNRLPPTIAVLLLSLCGLEARGAEQANALRLVPFPKEVRLESGSFSFRRAIVAESPGAAGGTATALLAEELELAHLPPVAANHEAAGMRLRLMPKDKQDVAPARADTFRQNATQEDYLLEIRPDEIVCAAPGRAGLMRGVATLRQLIRANRRDGAIPCLVIRDWPSLAWRAFQDDMTRGPSPRMETLKFEAGLGAYLKFNLMTYYMEYQYAFRKHPKIGPEDGSLTPEELKALVALAKPLGIDILGNQQSFGHFGAILRHEQYAPMRESGDVLSPVKEETYQLLDDLYSEVCPLLPLEFFNVCCDETYGLGTGPSKDLAKQIGVGGVYVRHIRRVHDLLRDKYHKRMMMWGDIILQHPQNLAEIPKDTIMLTWGYDARLSFEDQIVPFARSGYAFFVCPGVSNWSRILPDFGVATENIRNFVRDGAKHGAMGMINTDWKDDGEALRAMKWHADAWAAECAWNASATDAATFNCRLGAVLFGEQGDHFGQAIELLAKTHRMAGMNGMNNGRFWESDFLPKRSAAAIRESAEQLLGVVRPAIEHLEACRNEAVTNQVILDQILLGARRMELIGRRMLDGLEVSRLYAQAQSGPAKDAAALVEKAEAIVRAQRDAHEALGRQFSAMWLAESKPFALDATMRRYSAAVKAFDDLLGKLAEARQAAAEDKPLPLPQSLGLAEAKP